MRETSPILNVMSRAQHGLSSFNPNEHNREADIARDGQTRDWVNSRCSTSFGRSNIVERRDVIDKQLHAANKLAGELARVKKGEQKSASVDGLKNKAKCQDLRFVGGWVNETDKHS